MQIPPIDVLESWPVANYDHPSEVRGPAILVLTFVFVPLLVLLVALRIYTRLRLTKNFGHDDMAIVAAVFPTLACASLTVYCVLHTGWDRHIWDVRLDKLVLSLKLALAIETLFSLACTLTRLSILLLVLRLMTTARSVLRRLAIWSMVMIIIEEVIFTVVVVKTCSPISDYWTLSFAPQQCINEAAHLLAAGIVNSFNDFCVVLIPIPVVLKLRLPLRQRIFCACLFGAGFIVCFAGAVRIYFLYQLNTSYDKTWLAYPAWICGTLELYLGIMATTIPAIKPLVARYFPRILGTGFSRRGGATDLTTRGGVGMQSEQIGKSLTRESVTPDFVRIPSPVLSVDARGVLHAKSRPLILSPVVSTFSTYVDEHPALPVNEWKRSPLAEVESSGTSLSSFDATWTPK